MKKIFIVICTVSLNLMFLSCTDNDELKEYQDRLESVESEKSCCGDDGDIPPPPPPPKDPKKKD
ncbi:hypothetical protein [Tenacibaculum xiamenense]|uniref:hypothetical protein n=1 Tax=Tenacibaculum xiamenense TaxID=1261553 RepID=UPI003895DEBE